MGSGRAPEGYAEGVGCRAVSRLLAEAEARRGADEPIDRG
jgi:hypothetical protein